MKLWRFLFSSHILHPVVVFRKGTHSCEERPGYISSLPKGDSTRRYLSILPCITHVSRFPLFFRLDRMFHSRMSWKAVIVTDRLTSCVNVTVVMARSKAPSSRLSAVNISIVNERRKVRPRDVSLEDRFGIICDCTRRKRP